MTTAAPMPLPFPFAAISGQPLLRQALLLAAVDPGLGGVLIEGPRGTAKTTAARALAELLPGAPFVTLPLGASLESLVGTLDLGQALAGHELRFAPGLLARAHGGVLYVDEINLLPDALIDSLLDAAASGVNVVERDGISHRHAARFVLVGTMNPEEGTLRPQLLDRFGLCVQLRNIENAAERQAIVRARLAFDADPQGFRAKHAQEEAALAATLVRAKAARGRCARVAVWRCGARGRERAVHRGRRGRPARRPRDAAIGPRARGVGGGRGHHRRACAARGRGRAAAPAQAGHGERAGGCRPCTCRSFRQPFRQPFRRSMRSTAGQHQRTRAHQQRRRQQQRQQ
jgi:MoxR-like ATPase